MAIAVWLLLTGNNGDYKNYGKQKTLFAFAAAG